MSDKFEIAEKRWKRIRIIAGISAAVVLVLGAAVWFGRPAYRHFKETRSLKQAREFLQKGDLRNGALSLRQALAANPLNLEATRKMAGLLAEAQSPAALGWWQRVVVLSPTLEHRVLLVATALRVEKPPFPLATQMLAELQKAGAETNTSYQLVASQLALRLNRLADAAKHLDAAVKLEPTNRLHQLNLATLRLRQADSAVAAQARQELAALVSDPALGQHALRSLTADGLAARRFEEAERFSNELLALPQARFDDRLQHLSLLAAAGNAQTNQFLTLLQDEASTNVAKAALVVGWLSGQRRPREALDWLAQLDPALRATPPLPLVEADCRLALKDWTGLEQFLADQNWEEQEALRLALMARAMREQGRREPADAQWRRALIAPGGKGEVLATVAQMAASWGWKAEAEDALWALVTRAPWQDGAWQELIRARSDAGDTPGLYRVYSALLENKPDAVDVKNNVAAIGLLLNRDREKCARLAREVYLAATNNATFVSTHAFALHHQGNSAEALRLMQALPAKELERPNVATYYAILLAANGQHDQAAPYVAIAEKARPLPEEEQLLEAVRAGK